MVPIQSVDAQVPYHLEQFVEVGRLDQIAVRVTTVGFQNIGFRLGCYRGSISQLTDPGQKAKWGSARALGFVPAILPCRTGRASKKLASKLACRIGLQ